MKSPLQTYLTLATESAKRSLRESGNANPSDLQAAVIVINEPELKVSTGCFEKCSVRRKGSGELRWLTV